jgi:glycyl-tRNA synthetase
MLKNSKTLWLKTPRMVFAIELTKSLKR